MLIFQLEYWQIFLIFLPLLFVFWSLWDINKNTFKNPNEKYLWIFGCALLPVIGSIIYLIFGKKRTVK